MYIQCPFILILIHSVSGVVGVSEMVVDASVGWCELYGGI